MKPIMLAIPFGPDMDDPESITVVEIQYPSLIAINSIEFEDWGQIVDFFPNVSELFIDQQGRSVPVMGSRVEIPALSVLN